MQRINKKLLSNSFYLTLFLLIAKVIVFFKDMLIASIFGVSSTTDAFYVSSNIIALFSSIILGPFASAYMPIAADYIFGKNNSLDEKKNFIGLMYKFTVVISIIFTLIIVVFISQIINLVVPGFKSETKILLSKLIMLQIPYILTMFIIALNATHLRIYEKYIFADLNLFLVPLTLSIVLVLSKLHNVYILCIIISFVNIVVMLIQLVILKNINLPVTRKTHNIKMIRPVLISMLPFLLTSGARAFNTIVDKMVASHLDEGSITILSYAYKIPATEMGLVGTSISLIVFSMISINNANENDSSTIVIESLELINFILLPMVLMTILFRYQIIDILFNHGNFTDESMIITANTMVFYSIGIVAGGYQDIISRALYGYKLKFVPILSNIILVFVNATLNFILYEKFKTYGIAFASSISLIIIIPILYVYARVKILTFNSKKHFYIDIITVYISGIISFMFGIWLLRRCANFNKYFVLFIGVIVFGLIYLLFLYIIKNGTMINAINLIKSKLKKAV